MQTFKKIMLTVICLIIGFVICFFAVYIPVHNESVAKALEDKLLSAPLPENTEFYESLSATGKLTGNGNGMQYFGGILIKSELTEEELEEYYSEFRSNDWEFEVKPQTDSEITVIEHGSYIFDTLTDETNFDGYYIVYSWGSNNSIFNDFDLRGH